MKEWLTDKEKRILFSALKREELVCVEVDKECYREPYEESLVSIVKSLEHKFYYDRLFKKMEKEIKSKTIDLFMNTALELIRLEQDTRYGYLDGADIREIAEQLKESGENED